MGEIHDGQTPIEFQMHINKIKPPCPCHSKRYGSE